MKKILLPALAGCLLIGCTSVTATKTTNGVTESIKVDSFLAVIHNGLYTNGTGISLSVSDATPDQQSIAILAGAVTELGKTAMLMSKAPTNTVSTPK